MRVKRKTASTSSTQSTIVKKQKPETATDLAREKQKAKSDDPTTQVEVAVPTVVTKRLQFREISKIQFGLMAPEQKRKKAVYEVTTAALHIRRKPAENGIFDLRGG